jgi:DNA-3-methyladenine glycosylase II
MSDSSTDILRLTRETFDEGRSALGDRDPDLDMWIDRIGTVPLRRQRHQFHALCRAIISQQLSAKAAKTICDRFLARFAPATRPDAATLRSMRVTTLRNCGLSRQKIEYLRDLARAYDGGGLAGVRLSKCSDAEVIERLTAVRGIGVWTAEMFLIFSLGRLDVFSVGDLALRAGVERVVGRSMTHAEIDKHATRWAPYRSVASLYLWRIAHWKDASSASI